MVRGENNIPIDSRYLFDIFRAGRTVYVARSRGQHSGNDQCLMRYAIATAYVPEGNSTRVRYWVNRTDIRGLELCTSAAGTGINGPPRPRYGSAADRRGNCKHQIRVCDEGDPPRR
jgi:hypothetical protein